MEHYIVYLHHIMRYQNTLQSNEVNDWGIYIIGWECRAIQGEIIMLPSEQVRYLGQWIWVSVAQLTELWHDNCRIFFCSWYFFLYTVRKSHTVSGFVSLCHGTKDKPVQQILLKTWFFPLQKESEKLHVNEEKFMELDKQIKSLGK